MGTMESSKRIQILDRKEKVNKVIKFDHLDFTSHSAPGLERSQHVQETIDTGPGGKSLDLEIADLRTNIL